MKNIDINILHECFEDQNKFGQTTLMFDSILRTIELELDDLDIYVIGKDASHANNLFNEFYYFLVNYFIFHNLISKHKSNYGFSIESAFFPQKIYFIGKYLYDNYYRGLRKHYLFIDHYVGEFESDLINTSMFALDKKNNIRKNKHYKKEYESDNCCK